MDSHMPHYLTIAAFRVTEDAHSPNEVTIDEHMPFHAALRKVCICGASIEFDQEADRWLCSSSGVELRTNHWNCVPLIKGTNLGNLDVSDLRHPDCTSVVTFGE